MVANTESIETVVRVSEDAGRDLRAELQEELERVTKGRWFTQWKAKTADQVIDGWAGNFYGKEATYMSGTLMRFETSYEDSPVDVTVFYAPVCGYRRSSQGSSSFEKGEICLSFYDKGKEVEITEKSQLEQYGNLLKSMIKTLKQI